MVHNSKFGLALAAVLALLLLPCASAQNAAQIKTLAGLGIDWSVRPFAQSGVQAVTVPLNKPAALAYDAGGNFYVADENNNFIRKVDTAGILTTYAGTGDQDFYGDGGQATAAAMNHPQGVAVDAAGTMYISDTGNQRVRKVTAGGVITTLAGTGAAGYAGDGAAATAAVLNRPAAVAVDASSNVFFADSNNNRIREIVAATSTIQTVAGSGVQGFAGDGGPATSALLDTPEGIAVDASGTLYLSDTRNHRIRKIANATITTIAGTGSVLFAGDGGTALAATFDSPRGLAVASDGTIYIADANNNRIRQIAPNGTVTTVAGNSLQGQDKTNGTATATALDTPRAVAVGPLGSFSIADTSDGLVRNVSSNGFIVTTAGIGTAPTTPLTLTVPSLSLIYGQGSIAATAGTSAPVTGSFVFYDFGAVIGTAPATNNTATLPIGGLLKAGPHSLSASFAGDTTYPAAVTSVTAITVTPLAITASTGSTTQPYGLPIPAQTGTLNGVLSQDASSLTLALSTTATTASSPGSYPVTGILGGTAALNYTLAQPVGTLTITKANVAVSIALSTVNALLNAPLAVTASVASTTSGTPSGVVSILDGGNVLVSGLPVAGGTLQYVLSGLSSGTHNLTAVYAGDVNFNSGTSAASTTQVNDFSFTLSATSSGGASQTVIPGRTATYNFTATSAGGSFPYPVALTVAGLPNGATGTLTPSTISLSSGSTAFTLTVSTPANIGSTRPAGRGFTDAAPLLALLLLPAAGRLRRRVRRMLSLLTFALAVLSLGALLGMTGCGSSTGFFGTAPQNYTLSVTGTATNGQGSTLQRAATVTLTVQ